MQQQTRQMVHIVGGSFAAIFVLIWISVWCVQYVGFGGSLWPGRGINKFVAQLYDYPLPPQTEIIETSTVYERMHNGNGGPNDAAVMLVQSELSLTELTAYYEAGMAEARGMKQLADGRDNYQETYHIRLYVRPAAAPLPTQKPGNTYWGDDAFFYYYFDSLKQTTNYTNLYFIAIID